jgi:hypothetical protein
MNNSTTQRKQRNIEVIRDGSEPAGPTPYLSRARCGKCGEEVPGNNVFCFAVHACQKQLPPPKQIVIRFLPVPMEGVISAGFLGCHGGFEVEFDGKSSGDLGFGEMIEQIIGLTHPKLDKERPRYPMMSPLDWKKYYEAWHSAGMKGEEEEGERA